MFYFSKKKFSSGKKTVFLTWAFPYWGGGGGSDNVGKIPTFYRFLFWRTSLISDEQHLKYIVLNDNPVPFLQKNLDYLIKDNYDKEMKKVLANSELVPLQNLKSYAVEHESSDSIDKSIKVIYKTKSEFKAAVKVLGIMDDFKSGVPRMAYNGVVSTFYKGIRVYLWPGMSWKNYNPTW